MTEYFSFLFPEYNPIGLTGLVGGDITSDEISSSINLLLTPVQPSGLIPIYQYRKFWIKQTANVSFSSLGIELANTEYDGRISIAQATGLYATGTAATPEDMPDNLIEEDFTSSINDSIDLISGEKNDTYAIWLRQVIASGDKPDSMASVNVRITGSQ